MDDNERMLQMCLVSSSLFLAGRTRNGVSPRLFRQKTLSEPTNRHCLADGCAQYVDQISLDGRHCNWL